MNRSPSAETASIYHLPSKNELAIDRAFTDYRKRARVNALCSPMKDVILAPMPVIICMLRGVNVGGHHKLPMSDLRELCTSLGLLDPKTYVQSGNVIFRVQGRLPAGLKKQLEQAIEKRFGFHSDVILRTAREMRQTVELNPFAGLDGIEPARLAVTFLHGEPTSDARKKLAEIKCDPEEMHAIGRELYVYFPEGMGRSKFPFAAVARIVGEPGTARNWNSVTKMLELAEQLEQQAST